MSDRVAVIASGRLMQVDTPRALYDRPANRFVAEFIGESSLLPVQAAAGAWAWQGHGIEITPGPGEAASALSGKAWLMLRPERVRVGRPGEVVAPGSGPARTNTLHARVGDVIYQGDTFLVQAVLEDGSRISARGIASAGALDRIPQRGEPVSLHFDAGDAVLVPD
jgi:putative spermidine/putrescine transport system ATP-binding protein